MPRQCSSCGGFCNKSGCARESAQPEKEWIGLTDDDIDKIYNREEWEVDSDYNYEYAIEAKLKEKNS